MVVLAINGNSIRKNALARYFRIYFIVLSSFKLSMVTYGNTM